MRDISLTPKTLTSVVKRISSAAQEHAVDGEVERSGAVADDWKPDHRLRQRDLVVPALRPPTVTIEAVSIIQPAIHEVVAEASRLAQL